LFHHEEIPAALERRVLGSVEMVTVCGVGHPWRSRPTPIDSELARHRQLLMSPQTAYPGRADQPAGLARRQLLRHGRIADARSRLGLAAAPCGVPAYQSLLVELEAWTPPPLVVELVWRRDELLGPAAEWLGRCFAEHLKG
jgi:DNA-binding transcriptional LysR family regulator